MFQVLLKVPLKKIVDAQLLLLDPAKRTSRKMRKTIIIYA